MIYLYWRIWLETKKRYRDLTTLFLVSGVGAAAPARATRPLHSAANNLNSRTNLAKKSPPISKQQGQQLALPRASNLTADPLPVALTYPPQAVKHLGLENGPQTSQGESVRSNQPAVAPSLGHRSTKRTGPSLANRANQEPSNSELSNIVAKDSNQLKSPARCPARENPCQENNYQAEETDRCKNAMLSGQSVLMEGQVSKCNAPNLKQGSTVKGLSCEPSLKCKCPCCPRSVKPGKVKNLLEISMAGNSLSSQSQGNQKGCTYRRAGERSKLANRPDGCQYCRSTGNLCGHPIEWQCKLSHCDCKLQKETTCKKPTETRDLDPSRNGHQVSCDKESSNHRCHHKVSNSSKLHCCSQSGKLPKHRHYHHHHHHNNHHQHHRHHRESRQADNRTSDRLLCCDGKERANGLMDKQSSKLSLISSSYQLLSANAKPISCNSIKHKVHPTGTISGLPAEVRSSHLPLEVSSEPESHSGDRRTTLSNTPLSCNLAGQHDLSQDITDLDAHGQQADTAIKTVDTATSPIQFESPSPRIFDSEELEDRDFETRIVSSGDRFRFESDDLCLSSVLRLKATTERRLVGGGACKKQKTTNCKRCHRAKSSNTNSSCARALMIHDVDCHICHSVSESHHMRAAGCRDCERALNVLNVSSRLDGCPHSDSLAKGSAANRPADNTISEQGESGCNGGQSISYQDGKQPILGSFQQEFLEDGACGEQAFDRSSNVITDDLLRDSGDFKDGNNGKQKKAKKFSQKLTFRDVLVEPSNKSSDLGRKELSKIADDGLDSRSNDSMADGCADHALAFKSGDQVESDRQVSGRPVGDHLNWIKRLFRPSPRTLPRVQLDLAAQEKRSLSRLCFGGTKRCNHGRGKRISSNDSSLQKNSSSEDSELGANQNGQASSKSAHSSHHPIQPKSERKAAKTLSTLLLVFIVTWLPYNILVLIKTLSGGEDQIPEKIWGFSYYLCYINSTINPLCYALCNAQFRRTYMRILKCKLSNEHNSTRRLVPLQSSTTWNKDLRLTSDLTNSNTPAGQALTNSHLHNHNNSGHHSRSCRQRQN